MLNAQTLGLDIADQFTSYCLLDDAGEVLEEGRLRTSPDAFSQRLCCLAGRVVIEAGTHSPWVSRLFGEAGLEVVVANPRKVRLIAQATRKNDRADAATLARLGRVDNDNPSGRVLNPDSTKRCNNTPVVSLSAGRQRTYRLPKEVLGLISAVPAPVSY